VAGARGAVEPVVRALSGAGVRVSLFIEASARQIETAAAVGAQVVELHTGAYCDAVKDGEGDKAARILAQLTDGARLAASLGLEVHAGHGIDYDSVTPVSLIPEVVELNIGHFLIGEAIFIGLPAAIAEMRALMDEAR
jgi:pyridoxine 5-phosphate synthase